MPGVKSIARNLAAPILRPIWRRIRARTDAAADAKIAQVEAKYAPYGTQLASCDQRLSILEAAWRQHIPAFLNAVATVPSFAHELAATKNSTVRELAALQNSLAENAIDQSNLWTAMERANREVGQLWERLEFARKEIMYEVRFGQTGTTTGLATPSGRTVVEPRTKNVSKVENACRHGQLRLNIGCGHIALDNYVNIDQRDLPGVDVVADAGNLPFEPGQISEIASFHVLEHFPQEQLRRLLAYWHTLLKPGGQLRAVAPDGEAMLSQFAAGQYTFENFRMVLFGAQEYEGDFHFNLLTPDSIKDLLTEAGFIDIRFLAKARKNDIAFEFDVTATAP